MWYQLHWSEMITTRATRRCSLCNVEKQLLDFHRSSREKDGRRYRCKKCVCETNRTHYRSGRYSQHRWRQSISRDEYGQMLQSQDGLCLICKQPETSRRKGILKKLCVDHSHKCCPGERSCGKCVRGLLCGKCNVGLGLFKDEPSLLRTAAIYLENYNVD